MAGQSVKAVGRGGMKNLIFAKPTAIYKRDGTGRKAKSAIYRADMGRLQAGERQIGFGVR